MNSMYHVRAAVLHEEGTITWTKNGRVDWNDDDLVIGQYNVSKEIQHLGEAASEIKHRYRNVRHTKRLDKEFVIQQMIN